MLTGPRDAGLKGGHLSPQCSVAPSLGLRLNHMVWLLLTSSLCPLGCLFLFGAPQNELPREQSPNGVYHQPPIALAYPCIDNSQFSVLRSMHLRGFRPSRHISLCLQHHSFQTQAVHRTHLAGIGAAICLAAPWGGFAYHNVTLTNLTKSIDSLAQDTGDSIQNLQ